MSQTPRWFVLVLLVAALLLSGCATVRQFDPANPIALKDGEGILLVHVVTNVDVESIVTTAGVVAKSVEPGDYLYFLVVKEGSYRWNHVNRTIGPWEYRWYLWPKHLNRNNNFTIEPGQINYLGSLKLDGKKDTNYMSIRVFNQSAMMFREIQLRHPKLLQSRTMRFAGMERDEFLGRYQAALAVKMKNDSTRSADDVGPDPE